MRELIRKRVSREREFAHFIHLLRFKDWNHKVNKDLNVLLPVQHAHMVAKVSEICPFQYFRNMRRLNSDVQGFVELEIRDEKPSILMVNNQNSLMSM